MNVAYPDKFGFLNEQHEEVRRMMTELDTVLNGQMTGNFKMALTSVLRALMNHHEKEEQVMRDQNYPERDIHTSYHRHAVGVINSIIQLYDIESTEELRQRIAAHVANTVSEEVFFDRQLMDFLQDK